ncbi:hypothetical protein ACHAW5_007581 [Stephanodiscus triporus]|uniref:Plastid lipid-associated protein/fibrillin conserved domain-containing protein n=1 Tax=Stephanodiscus triporus TaxID=2934178 RepID=A0ABD3QAC2_9STRA
MTTHGVLVSALCICAIHQAAAFTPVPPSRVHSSSSTTARFAIALPELSLLADLFTSADARRSQLKRQILDLASETERGLTATDEQKRVMEGLFVRLEALNPTRDPLVVGGNKKPSVNGDWSLDYTTSDSILGKGGFARVGPIIQNIDTTTLSAKNSEVVRYGVVDVPRSVTAELSPVNGKMTDVKFKRFMLGPIGFDAPETFRGSLDITYLDDEMRLTRGDKGNIFVLTRMPK